MLRAEEEKERQGSNGTSEILQEGIPAPKKALFSMVSTAAATMVDSDDEDSEEEDAALGEEDGVDTEEAAREKHIVANSHRRCMDIKSTSCFLPGNIQSLLDAESPEREDRASELHWTGSSVGGSSSPIAVRHQDSSASDCAPIATMGSMASPLRHDPLDPLLSSPAPLSPIPCMPVHSEDSYACREGIELMQYTCCQDLIMSDHKPVRAVLNMRVKRMDWAAYEAHRIESTMQFLSDPLHSSDSSHNMPQMAYPPHPSPYHSAAAHLSHVQVRPRAIALHSVTNTGDFEQLSLMNMHKDYRLRYRICDSHCSKWLCVDPVSGDLWPGEKYSIQVRNHHEESTLK